MYKIDVNNNFHARLGDKIHTNYFPLSSHPLPFIQIIQLIYSYVHHTTMVSDAV